MRFIRELWSMPDMPFDHWIWAVGEKMSAKQVGLLLAHAVELVQPEIT
jgi:hypothetical protein